MLKRTFWAFGTSGFAPYCAKLTVFASTYVNPKTTNSISLFLIDENCSRSLLYSNTTYACYLRISTRTISTTNQKRNSVLSKVRPSSTSATPNGETLTTNCRKKEFTTTTTIAIDPWRISSNDNLQQLFQLVQIHWSRFLNPTYALTTPSTRAL